MFIKYYLFDWLFLFTNAMWIIGGAIILTVVSYVECKLSRTNPGRHKAYATRSIKRWLFLGFILVVCGYASSPNESFIAKETYSFIDLRTYDTAAIFASRINIEKQFRNQDVEMFINTNVNRFQKYPFDDATITMPWNGYIGTPFIAFEKGKYALEFEASGSKAGGEFAKIFVYIVILKKSRLSLRELIADQKLSAERRLFSFIFQAEGDIFGKCRIQYYNDTGDEKNGNRNAFIGKIKIKKIT